MTLRLILMRHAKSDWDSPAGGDFDRPLSKRGRKAAQAMGNWLATSGYTPDLVLCSSAARTRETWALVSSQIGGDPAVEYLKDLYLAAPELMLQHIIDVDSAKTKMMIAHNPGSAILAQAIVDHAPAHSRFDDYPTAATTVVEFAVDDWDQVKPGHGQVIDFAVPRDLV